jgi:hypothetical protein
MAKTPKLSLDAKINALTRLLEKRFGALQSAIDHRPTNSNVAHIVDVYLHQQLRPIKKHLGIGEDGRDLNEAS